MRTWLLRRPVLRRTALTVASVLIGILVSGCYLPLRLEAQISVNRAGFYEMAYDGMMTWVPLYREVRRGDLTADAEREKAERIADDLRRDPSTSQAIYLGNGIFDVDWERSGDLLRVRSVTFIRRNSPLLTLSYSRDKQRIIMTVARPSPSQAQRLAEAGLRVEGELRLRTEGRVLFHNAEKVVEGRPGGTLYVWRVEQAPEPPRLEIEMR